MRICRTCKGILRKDGYCPKCDRQRSRFDSVEIKDIPRTLYSLYVEYVRRFHEQDAPTMLCYRDFASSELRDRTFMEYLLSLFGMHHRIPEYVGYLDGE